MVSLLWICTILSAMLGGVVLLFTVIGSSGAPQEAAGAAMACALGVLPYVAARAVSELHGERPAARSVTPAVAYAPPVLTPEEAAAQAARQKRQAWIIAGLIVVFLGLWVVAIVVQQLR